MTLSESHNELLRFVIAERDCFYDCCSNDDGAINDESDQQELDEMDAIIDRARVAQSLPSSKLIENISQIFKQLDASNNSPHGDAPNHWHDRAGIWDYDNNGKANTVCEWCKLWNETKAMLPGATT